MSAKAEKSTIYNLWLLHHQNVFRTEDQNKKENKNRALSWP